MFRLFNKFYDTPGDSGIGNTVDTGGGGNLDSPDKLFKALNTDDEPVDDVDQIDLTEKKEKTKEKTKEKEDDTKDDEEEIESEEDLDDDDDDEEDDELKDLLDETEEPTKEQLELVTPVRRREILKKYPNLFKEFPYLEKAYYREQQYTEVFPQVEDAKAAAESVKILDKFESELIDGNIETIFSAIKGENENSFYKIIDNLIPTLAKVDERAYHHVLGSTIKHTIISMVQEGNKSNNDTLKAAAQILNQFVFGSSEFVPPGNLAKEQKPEEKTKDTELSEREKAFNKRQFESAQGEVSSRLNATIQRAISDNIDPRDSMTEYVKRNAIREANERLGELIGKDTRFKVIVDKLWENAFKNQFNKDSIDRIRKAYISKAQTLLPAVLKQARNEALRGMGRKVKEDSTEERRDKKSEQPRSKSSGRSSVETDTKQRRNISTLDFLNKD